MSSTFDGCLKQRRGYSLLNSFHSLVISSGLTNTDMCDSFICHNCLNIREVKVDQCRQIDQVCNSLDSLLQNLVSFAKCFRHSCTTVYDLKQFVVRDNDQCINSFLQILDSCKSIVHTCFCFKTERFCYNANGQDSHFLSCCCNNRSCTCTGTTTHSTGNKYHVSAFDQLFYFFYALFSGLLTNFRLCTGAKAFCNLFTNLKYCWSFAKCQGLFISIYTNKLNSSDGFFHHSVNCIITSPAYTDYNNLCRGLSFI